MEIEINQDIRKFKVKDIGPFSFKQAGFIVLGGGLGYLIYTATNTLPMSIIPAIGVAAFGFLKPFGMTFMQALRLLMKEMTVPPCYEYETDFVYSETVVEKLKKQGYTVYSSEELIQSNTDNNKKKNINPNMYEEDLILR